MDAIAALLDGPRARGAFVLRAVLDPPWGLRIADEAPLTVVALVSGRACVVPDAGEVVVLQAGDVAIIRGPEHYTVADEPDRTPDIVIHPDQSCTTLDGRLLAEEMHLGVRTWGNAADGETVMLVGAYVGVGDVNRRVLSVLPHVVAVRAEEWDAPAARLLADEISREIPGQEAVLDRILDLLLIGALRTWLDREDSAAPGWYRAAADPIVGPALRLIHHNPAHPWTIAELAHEVGASRANLARRFNDLVGEPPMAYLAEWRISLAADLLLEPGATIGSVADQVGYSTPFALSAAFKRLRGHSPKAHRATPAA